MRIIFLPLLATCMALSAAPRSSEGTKKGRAVPTTPSGQADLLRDVRVCVEVESSSTATHAFVRFNNNSKVPLWFPICEDPASRKEDRSKTLWIWLGYFKKPHGEFRMHYVVPHMQEVAPGKDFRMEITSPELAQAIANGGLGLKLRARVATKAFVYTDVRGDQPLDDYVKNSIVVESKTVVNK